MNYKCMQNFTSSRGDVYKRDVVISAERYELLLFDEQEHFNPTDEPIKKRKKKSSVHSSKNEDDSLSSKPLSGGIAMGDMLNTGIPGGLDFNFSTPL